MHKLVRNEDNFPECLRDPAYSHYKQLRVPEKSDIRAKLLDMQGERCAYCERRTGTGKDDGHIEHFRDQSSNDSLTLDWYNLYWSCLDENTCGKNKDKCTIKGGTSEKREFDHDHILSPCVDDPDDYFQFVSDGKIAIREGLNEQQKLRATETLRVFQLQESSFLRKSREDAVGPYLSAIIALSKLSADAVKVFAQKKLVEDCKKPFFTTIRHFLESYI